MLGWEGAHVGDEHFPTALGPSSPRRWWFERPPYSPNLSYTRATSSTLPVISNLANFGQRQMKFLLSAHCTPCIRQQAPVDGCSPGENLDNLHRIAKMVLSKRLRTSSLTLVRACEESQDRSWSAEPKAHGDLVAVKLDQTSGCTSMMTCRLVFWADNPRTEHNWAAWQHPTESW